MRVTYVCGVIGIEVEGTSDSLPEGWLIPPHDVARDIEKDIPPRGTVICLSSEDVWRKLLKKRLEHRG